MSHGQELAVRKRRYAIMMGMRIPFLIAAFVFASTRWLAVTLLVLSIPLPWMAVLIANAGAAAAGQDLRHDERPRTPAVGSARCAHG